MSEQKQKAKDRTNKKKRRFSFSGIFKLRGVILISLYFLSCFALSLASRDKFIQFANFGLGFFSILVGGIQLQDWYWQANRWEIPPTKYSVSRVSGFVYFIFYVAIWMLAIFLPPLILVKVFNID